MRQVFLFYAAGLDVPQVTQLGCAGCRRQGWEALRKLAFDRVEKSGACSQRAHFQLTGLCLPQLQSRLFAKGWRRHPRSKEQFKTLQLRNATLQRHRSRDRHPAPSPQGDGANRSGGDVGLTPPIVVVRVIAMRRRVHGRNVAPRLTKIGCTLYCHSRSF